MEEEDIQPADYMSNPIISKYLNQLFLITDDLVRETDASRPNDEIVLMLRDVFRVVYTRVAIDGELVELDSILQMHFPIEYGPANSNSIPVLVEYPLSTRN